MDELRELEIQGCKTFICPNLGLIDEKGKILGLKDTTITRSKDIAIDYFKKTYHKPRYSSAKHVIPGIMYITCKIEGDNRKQIEIAKVFGVSQITIKKWYRDVMYILGLKKLKIEKKFKIHTLDIDSALNEIDKEGEALKLQDRTIEKAKNLAIKYFKISNYDSNISQIKQLCPAFIYTASLIENDSRRQMDIYKVSGMHECVISKWHNDILRVIGLKIIRCGSRTSCIKFNYDED